MNILIIMNSRNSVPRSNYTSTALSRPNMADDRKGVTGLTGLLPWQQRSHPPPPLSVSLSLMHTHTHTLSLSLCLSASVVHTHTHTHTHTYTVLQWNPPCFEIRALLQEAGKKYRKQSQEHRGTLHICFGWWVPADRLLFVYMLHPLTNLLINEIHHGGFKSLLLAAGSAAGWERCHMVCFPSSCLYFIISFKD